MATKTIRIPVIIDANGRWAAGGSSSLDDLTGDQLTREADFGFLTDCCMDGDADPVNPLRVWVTVSVPLPGTIEVSGAAEVAT